MERVYIRAFGDDTHGRRVDLKELRIKKGKVFDREVEKIFRGIIS